MSLPKTPGVALCVKVTPYHDGTRSVDYYDADPDTALALEVRAIQLSYPLSKECAVPFAGSVTRRNLVDSTIAAYQRVYAEEDAALSEPAGQIGGGCVNRAPTAGPWGIWGHGIDDLYIEGFVVENGVAYPCMGS